MSTDFVLFGVDAGPIKKLEKRYSQGQNESSNQNVEDSCNVTER